MPIQPTTDEQRIINRLTSEGYDNVWVYEAAPEEVDGEHSHDYDTKLHIVLGEIRIKIVENDLLTDYKINQGNEIEIPKRAIHSAKVGDGGCRYIVAERH